METELFDGKWWITGRDMEVECGPYDTKAEADSDRIGMKKFWLHEGKPGFVTCDSMRTGDLE